MKKWYLFYAENDGISDILQTFNSLIDTESEKLQQVAAEIHEKPFSKKLQQVVAEIPFPTGFSFVPWGHHCLIISKCKEVDEALYYLRRTIENGLSRDALDNIIRADLYHTSGSALTNFAEKLPAVQGDLAQERLKSNYDLTDMFLRSGFRLIKSEIIATGIWKENPYDGYPFAGENNNYGIIVVKK